MQLERRRERVKENEQSSERLISSLNFNSLADIPRLITCQPQPVLKPQGCYDLALLD
jgi:hypothetical protein